MLYASKTALLVFFNSQIFFAGIIQQRRRAPKLNKQMKSLSLDCAEMPPPVSSAMRSPFSKFFTFS